MDISFIIPAYNAENVIERSVSSIKKSRIDADVEIIIVNDGSTDTTESICKKMAEQDLTISVISIENSGQGIARNIGISRACGEYICFVDADDEVIIENIYQMWIKAREKKANIVIGSYIRKSGSQMQYPNLSNEEDYFVKSNNKKSLYHRIKTESVFGYVWNKLYEREFLTEHKLVMDDIRKVYMEDLLFNVKVWSCSPRVFYMGIPVYAYYVDNESTTRKADVEIHEKNIVMIENMISYLEKKGELEDNLDMVVPIIMRMYCWSVVKNIPYEGNSVKKIRYRSHAFCENEMIHRCLNEKHALKQLFYLPSLLQSIFYAFCLIGIRMKWNNLLAFVFFISYPLLKSYIASTLK